MIYASNLLYVATMFASKLVIAVFFYRLSNSTDHERYALRIIIACAVSFFVSFLIIALENDVSRPWLQGPSNEGSIVCICAFWHPLRNSDPVPVGPVDSDGSIEQPHRHQYGYLPGISRLGPSDATIQQAQGSGCLCFAAAVSGLQRLLR